MKHIVLVLIAIALTSCSSSKNIKEDALLYFGKTQCLGKCPVFDMYLFEDGKVLYEGFKNVTLLGKHESKITTEEIKDIKQRLEKIDFSAKEKLTRDIPNTVLKFKGKKLIAQNNEEIKDLLILLEKIKL
ncbi:DUF6438 domain-containing protein [Tenacibaculum caenipelagi]|uniref:DUF6438 domain-containing protein n=1 Tax=Tenacibaculum caenipelagi TaxID=1325435 RepID=A0A4R6TG13_9FLAO|nr:DUF6438 domain-containing protein [Tenacibaculum caenipelagi]TDQ25598.1 hypothetical protein DFQ07_2023 [Tenacibaculum caenipelagi]